MIRKTMKMLLIALVAVFTVSSMAEAAPKTIVRHRARHSSRVSSSSGATVTSAKKPAVRKKAATAAQKRSGTSASTMGTRKPAVAKEPTLKPPTTKRQPTTKPR